MLKKYVNITGYNMTETDNAFDKLKSLLKKIFRVDYEDLDFGIYKIMNYKSEVINNFIDNIKENLGNINLNDEEVELFYNDVYNRIYDFFSRYFDNGDLIPQLRFGGKTKYYIPYNGAETSLYWVNNNEYYIKTTEYFYKYVFKAFNLFDKSSNWKIIFKIKEAQLEKNYVKSNETKYFVLDDNPILLDDKNMELTVFFNYRKLCDDDLEKYSISIEDRNIQDKLKSEMINTIFNIIKNEDLIYILNSKENNKTVLEKHLNIYIKKNNTDYFIHKNLKEFLWNELEFYLKEEILNIDNIDESYEKIKKIRNISIKIIEFLAQIEGFQKKLWVKKKYIYNVNYVITLDKIENKNGSELINKIISSRGIVNQINEWKQLGIIDDNFKKESIIENNLTLEVNVKCKFLPLDTKYFNEFKYEILSLFDNLDDELDGTLIHSENYQALNTILPKFKENIQTIYIDPPFNKENNADYLYNVKYKDSTWITMLENRIRLAKDSLNENGSIFVRCDYNGNMYVRMLLNQIFGQENFRNEVMVNRTQEFFKYARGLNKFMIDIDTLFFFAKTENTKFFEIRLKREIDNWWEPFLPGKPKDEEDKYRVVLGKKIAPIKGRKWGLKQEQIEELEKYGRIKIEGEKVKYAPLWTTLKNNWTDIPGYSRGWNFQTENSEILLKRVIESTSNKNDIVIDFYLGSGTTTAVAHKLKRKWIGIEMGEHFYTVVLPRMKKVLYYDKSGVSKEDDVKQEYNDKRAGGFFKYFDLEQYEDSLNNIEFDASMSESKSLHNLSDYEIKYMLDYETGSSRIFLNVKLSEDPFFYKLKIINDGEEKTVNIDLPETFNYIYNVKVNKILSFDEKKYIFVLGKKDDENLLIVWRPLNNINYEEDRDLIYKIIDEYFNHVTIDTVLTNGNNIIDNGKVTNGGKSLDPIYNKLIFGGE